MADPKQFKYVCPHCGLPAKTGDGCVALMGSVMTGDRQISLLYSNAGDGLVVYHLACYKEAFGVEALTEVICAMGAFEKASAKIQQPQTSSSQTDKTKPTYTSYDMSSNKKNNNKLN